MGLLSADTKDKNYIARIAGMQDFTRNAKVSASTIASAAVAKNAKALGYVCITEKGTGARCAIHNS